MIEFPIIYLISAIGVEVVKDVAKHLGKKTYEIISNLEEPIIKLGISDYENREEIRHKLNANPEVKREIEKVYQNNQIELDHLIKVLKETPNLTVNKFYSKDNEKVINIDKYHGIINM